LYEFYNFHFLSFFVGCSHKGFCLCSWIWRKEWWTAYTQNVSLNLWLLDSIYVFHVWVWLNVGVPFEFWSLCFVNLSHEWKGGLSMWHGIFESSILYNILIIVLLIFWIFRYPMYHRLCDGRTREVGHKISCSSKVDLMLGALIFFGLYFHTPAMYV
jgi:hypothetical protein